MVRNECDYNWQTLLDHAPKDLYSVPLIFMHRAFTKYCRYIDGYRVGFTPTKFEFASKNHKIHRSIPEEFLNYLLKNKFPKFGQMRFKSVTTV